MSDIIISGLKKSFGEKQVLNGLDLTFPENGVTCIMGPSGCGKTTLLNIIAGLVKPDSGTVSGVPEKISFVFQEDRLCEDFSAVSNIKLASGKRLSEEEIMRHLDALGIKESAHVPVKTLSGGMKRRVAIARAVCYGPELLILDEAFKGLDDERRRLTMDYIKAECGGKTILCVTHDPDEAAYMGGTLTDLGEKTDDDK